MPLFPNDYDCDCNKVFPNYCDYDGYETDKSNNGNNGNNNNETDSNITE